MSFVEMLLAESFKCRGSVLFENCKNTGPGPEPGSTEHDILVPGPGL